MTSLPDYMLALQALRAIFEICHETLPNIGAMFQDFITYAFHPTLQVTDIVFASRLRIGLRPLVNIIPGFGESCP